MIFTDEELMERYQEGDLSSFNELFVRYNKKVFSYVNKRVKGEDAFELYQEVFRKLHEYRMRYDSRYHFAPWFFTLIRNLLIDYYRKEKKVELLEFDETYMSPRDEEIIGDIDLGVLDTSSQSLIAMRYFDNREFKDIALEMKITEVNVRKKISRAIKKLRESWRQE